MSSGSGTETEKSEIELQGKPASRTRGRGRSSRGRGRSRGGGRTSRGRKQLQGLQAPEESENTETEESGDRARIAKAQSSWKQISGVDATKIAETDSDTSGDAVAHSHSPVCAAELTSFCRWVLRSKLTDQEREIIRLSEDLLV